MRRGAFFSLCGEKATQRLLPLVTVVVALLVGAAPAGVAAPQTSLVDIEDEVMCPICGTLLELSSSPQAERQRAFVKRQIAAGKTKTEIKEALVAEYGREVLAVPGGSGFDLSAYLVPAIAFLAAAVALALGVRCWRRAGRQSQALDANTAPGGEERKRLDADMARYDL